MNRDTQPQEITSRKNPLVAELRRLAEDRAYRRETGRCLGQGRKLLEEALQNGFVPDLLLYGGVQPELPAGVRAFRASEELLAYISPMKSAPELLFSCPLQREVGQPAGRLLLAEALQDPGNVGTMIRTAAAFGFDGLLLVGACADPWGPKAVRASMGGVFRLRIWEYSTAEEAVAKLRALRIPLYAAALAEETETAGEFAFPPALALAVGNEGHGLGSELLRAADAVIRIPMEPGAESLNAAAAAAVLMWEVYRGRQQHG